MADLKKFIGRLLGHEGGIADDKADRGGKTNKGITLQTWLAVGYDKDWDGDIDWEDLKRIDNKDAFKVVYDHYWSKWKADQILNQSLAELLVDWCYHSGTHGIRRPQRILNIEFKFPVIADGVVGPRTLEAVNRVDQEDFFDSVKAARLRFIDAIVRKDPTQKKFLRGWKNRINSFQFNR